ncbi:DUF2480 family protein [Agriterribacter sp.]|uniref:DUF2480 family protein n=1 Tax=Agriterribacter sp. TaxID=2821509 RepID=UPI002B61377B|nr:DUF2480 family protein [Agriterribacter sp.]HTN07247.1 DUF2480 family protein [Agriterribacter sp.]
MTDTIINKVAESGIVTIDLETYYPKVEIAVIDIKAYLFKGLILKEKEFREALKQTNWQQYSGKYIALTCTADAIIPMWAYMLIVAYVQPEAKDIIFGSEKDVLQTLLLNNITNISADDYAGKRIVIKGCGDVVLPEAAYAAITKKLRPVVKSLMYGEPCSTVPVYKAPSVRVPY